MSNSIPRITETPNLGVTGWYGQVGRTPPLSLSHPPPCARNVTVPSFNHHKALNYTLLSSEYARTGIQKMGLTPILKLLFATLHTEKKGEG